MKKLVKCIALALVATVLFSCTKPAPEVKKDYEITQAGVTDAPELMSFNGGKVTIQLGTFIETKAETVFVPWKYRICLGDETCEAVDVTEKMEELTVEVPGNYTLEKRTVSIQMAVGDDAEWETIVSFPQDAAIVRMVYEGDFDTFWAKGNVDVKDDRFIVAENYSDCGLLFLPESRFGVKAEAYSGTAYGPEAQEVALSSLAGTEKVDPCKLISENLRMPSYADFYFLENINYEDPYFDWVGEQNGVKGIKFKGSDFFLPFVGSVSSADGAYTAFGTNAGYWMMGNDLSGDHNIYLAAEDYTALATALVHTSMASVRCVLDRRMPTYKSHSFSTAEITDKQMTLNVAVDLGDYSLALVEIESENGDVYDASATATTNASVYVPANTKHEPVKWEIFVNRIDTGISFEQPAVRDYAMYVSHTPASSDYNAFTLSVTIDTDRDAVPVVVKGAGDDLTQTASKANPVVSFSIPANTGNERTLAIWVDGKDTKKTVKQGAAPKGGLSVEWSTGALTVKDGAYVFAAPTERGMLFKYKSKFGIQVEGTYSSSSKYPGYAYGPEKTTVAYADIATDQIDPCSLVAPAGTWRLPTLDELNEVKAADNGKSFEAAAYNTKLDGDTEIFFVGSGQMKDDGSGITLPTASANWGSTPGTTAGQFAYMTWALTSATSTFLVSSAGAKPTKAMQVRCVRSK